MTEMVQVLVRMPAELHDRLHAATTTLDLSKAQIIRRAIQHYLDVRLEEGEDE